MSDRYEHLRFKTLVLDHADSVPMRQLIRGRNRVRLYRRPSAAIRSAALITKGCRKLQL
jgi:hypothetical protein